MATRTAWAIGSVLVVLVAAALATRFIFSGWGVLATQKIWRELPGREGLVANHYVERGHMKQSDDVFVNTE